MRNMLLRTTIQLPFLPWYNVTTILLNIYLLDLLTSITISHSQRFVVCAICQG